jgi:hypothetical protein
MATSCATVDPKGYHPAGDALKSRGGGALENDPFSPRDA